MPPARRRDRPGAQLQLGPLLLGLWLLAAETGRRHPAAAHRLQECLSANRSQCAAPTGGDGAGQGSGCPALLLLRRHRLKHCPEVSLWFTVPWDLRSDAPLRCDQSRLEHHLASLAVRDREVGAMYESFVSILDRYDCDARYSVMHNCSTCKEAYRRWLCAVYLPYHGASPGGGRLRPCRSVCQRVQQTCPYLLPAERAESSHQYAGEPTFYCGDKDIPEVVPFVTGAPQYGDDDCCFHPGCVRGTECDRHGSCPLLFLSERPLSQRR
ncbi:transmembrane protein FAM155A-like [Amphibalanus amphitrite]|uniref:transmembrane protein FAM155A-like n=1 Tax=Amphibalanus amphitrite TaxID=1232801 RepID=UPI001C920787|nr:transmembrane protein FAM155A-like [Amphibalanus amphitrite]